jgi:predicted XRE-type DNA-binding protein
MSATGDPTAGRDPAPIGATESSGNVFADLGLADPEEALAKTELARQIGALLAERGLTQAQAAGLLGVDQPKVSALVRGRLEGFSLDRLLRFLLALDRDVEIRVAPRTRTGGPSGEGGRVRVVAVA